LGKVDSPSSPKPRESGDAGEWIICYIEEREVIKTIPKHLEVGLIKSRTTYKAYAPPAGYRREKGKCVIRGYHQKDNLIHWKRSNSTFKGKQIENRLKAK
jgi:hypothetical protein